MSPALMSMAAPAVFTLFPAFTVRVPMPLLSLSALSVELLAARTWCWRLMPCSAWKSTAPSIEISLFTVIVVPAVRLSFPLAPPNRPLSIPLFTAIVV